MTVWSVNHRKQGKKKEADSERMGIGRKKEGADA
jgi:hypothetical protein